MDAEERRPKRERKQVERIQSSTLTKSKRKLASKGGRHARTETASKAQRQENDSAMSALGKEKAEESDEEKSDAKVENEEEGSDEYEPSHGSSVTDESDDDFEPVPSAIPASQRRGKRRSASKTGCGHAAPCHGKVFDRCADAKAQHHSRAGSASCASQHGKDTSEHPKSSSRGLTQRSREDTRVADTVAAGKRKTMTAWKGASAGSAASSEIVDLRDAAGGVGGAEEVATLTAGIGNSSKDKEKAGAKAGPAEQDSAMLEEIDRLWQKECAYKRWLKEREAVDADPKHSRELLEFLEKRRAAFFDSKLRSEPDKIDGAAPEMTPSAEVRDCSASSLGARPVTTDGAPDATKAGLPPLSRSQDAGGVDKPNLHLAHMDELEREIARRKAANLHLANLQDLEKELSRRRAEEARKSSRLEERRGTSFPPRPNPSSAEKKEEAVGSAVSRARPPVSTQPPAATVTMGSDQHTQQTKTGRGSKEGKQDEDLVVSHEDLPADLEDLPAGLEAFENNLPLQLLRQQEQGLEGNKRSMRDLGLEKADERPRIHAFDSKEARKRCVVKMPSPASGAEAPQGSPAVNSKEAGGDRKQAAGAATPQSDRLSRAEPGASSAGPPVAQGAAAEGGGADDHDAHDCEDCHTDEPLHQNHQGRGTALCQLSSRGGTVQPCHRGRLREAPPSSEIEGLASSSPAGMAPAQSDSLAHATGTSEGEDDVMGDGDTADEDAEELSEYERRRLIRIQDNMQLMRGLGLVGNLISTKAYAPRQSKHKTPASTPSRSKHKKKKKQRKDAKLAATKLNLELTPRTKKQPEMEVLPRLEKPHLCSSGDATVKQYKNYLSTKLLAEQGIEVGPEKIELLCRGTYLLNDMTLSAVADQCLQGKRRDLQLHYHRRIGDDDPKQGQARGQSRGLNAPRAGGAKTDESNAIQTRAGGAHSDEPKDSQRNAAGTQTQKQHDYHNNAGGAQTNKPKDSRNNAGSAQTDEPNDSQARTRTQSEDMEAVSMLLEAFEQTSAPTTASVNSAKRSRLFSLAPYDENG